MQTPALSPARRRATSIAVVAIGGLATVLATVGFHHRVRALAMHWRDYVFFVDRYRHLLDVPVWRRVPLGPNGNDAFGFVGIDGYPTVHHELHASPIEYVLAAVMRATGSVALISALLALGHAVAFVYAHRRAITRERAPLVHVAMLALFVTSPPFVFSATFDLRPFELLGPFVLCTAVALVTRAPGRDFAWIAAMGLVAREDAALVLVLASVVLWLDGRAREAHRLYAVALAYAIAFHFVYVFFTGFAHEWSSDSLGALAIYASYPALALCPDRVRARLVELFATRRELGGALLVAPFVALMARQAIVVGWPGHQFVWTPRWYAPEAVLVFVVATALAARASPRMLRVGSVAFVAVALVGTVLGVRQLHKWHRAAAERAPLWALVESLPPQARVLADYRLCQAFAGDDELLVWDRLPAHLEPSPARDHPAESARLRRAVLAQEGLVVMRPAAYARFAAAMQATEHRRWERCAEGRDWIVLRPTPSATRCP